MDYTKCQDHIVEEINNMVIWIAPYSKEDMHAYPIDVKILQRGVFIEQCVIQ